MTGARRLGPAPAMIPTERVCSRYFCACATRIVRRRSTASPHVVPGLKRHARRRGPGLARFPRPLPLHHRTHGRIRTARHLRRRRQHLPRGPGGVTTPCAAAVPASRSRTDAHASVRGSTSETKPQAPICRYRSAGIAPPGRCVQRRSVPPHARYGLAGAGRLVSEATTPVQRLLASERSGRSSTPHRHDLNDVRSYSYGAPSRHTAPSRARALVINPLRSSTLCGQVPSAIRCPARSGALS